MANNINFDGAEFAIQYPGGRQSSGALMSVRPIPGGGVHVDDGGPGADTYNCTVLLDSVADWDALKVKERTQGTLATHRFVRTARLLKLEHTASYETGLQVGEAEFLLL
jgi:hypothetical protein